MLTYTIIDTLRDAARDALAFSSHDPVATWQDEYGEGRVYAVPVTVYAIVTRDGEGTELVGACLDAEEARELADEAAAAREEEPDLEAVASRLGVSEERAAEIVAAAARALSGLERPCTIWLDPETGDLHRTERGWLLDAMDWPDHYVALGGYQYVTVSEPEAARLIVEALDEREEG